jgi:hypothetical protein
MTDELTREQAIDELLAKQAIRDAICRYCRGEDRQDMKLSRSLWHPDGTAKYGKDLFDGPAREWSHERLAQHLGSHHQVGNMIIEVNGDRAVSETYVTARLWKKTDDGKLLQRVSMGRYLDRWSRRDGIWAVDHRRFVFDLSYDDASTVTSRNLDWFEGRNDAKDPSYEVLR